MIRIADSKDRKRGGTNRIARAPRKRQRAAFRVDIPGCPVRHQLRVRAFKAGTFRAIRSDLYVAQKVRFWIAPRCIVSSEFMIAGKVEQQPRLWRVGGTATPTTNDQDKND